LKRLTFFEGLVGSDADISAIFEIEEEYESALDIGESESNFEVQRQRRVIPIPRPRPSPSFTSQNTPPSPSNMPASARARLGSVVPKSIDAVQTLTSPLAQVFQPLVVDDNVPETTKPSTGPISISYGPATRRRVSSMQSTRPRYPESLNQAQTNAMKRFPPKPSPAEQSVLMQNLEERGESPSMERKDTAETGNDVGIINWMRRMEQMETRQERIESLLIQMAKDIRKLGE